MTAIKDKYNSLFFTQGGCLKQKDYWSYSMAGLGQNMIYGIMSSYLMIFYTDVFLIPSTVVGTMFLVAKLWDAINDPIMGTFVDKTRTKWGKMRPYLLFSPAPIAVITILLFTAPNLSNSGKIIYMYITYILWGMLYTVCDVPFWSMSSVLTPNTQERTKLVSFTRFMTGIGMGAPTVIVSLLMLLKSNKMLPMIACDDKRIYFVVAVFMSVLGSGLLSLGFFGTKEVVAQNEKKPTFKESMGFLLKNKPLMMVLLCNLLAFPKSIQAAMQVYIATYIMGGGQWVLILGIPATVGGIISYAVTPYFVKKLGAVKTYLYANLVAIIPMGLLFFFGYRFVTATVMSINGIIITLIFLTLSSLAGGTTAVVPTILIADCIDYMEYRTGERAEGVSFSVQTFMAKASAALQGWATGILLSVFSFIQPIKNSSGETIQQIQSISTLHGMWAMYTIIPALGSILCIIPLLFYDLKGEKLKMVQQKLAVQRLERSELKEKAAQSIADN